jgi:hypothetical protein
VFAKPRRASTCECERMPDENLSQALHTLNGDTVSNKVSDRNGRVAQLAASGKSDDEIITELYLRALCRPPDQSEIATVKEFLATVPTDTMMPTRQYIYEDLLWALINSKQFLFVR